MCSQTSAFAWFNHRTEKRSALRIVPMMVAVFCWTIFATAATCVKADELPNIVILYADDLGYGDVGCFNPESRIPTPYIDRLAREGTCFRDAHSSSGICTPSRFALLTGQYHWRRIHGIVTNFGPPVFKEGDWTMQQMLRDRGYRTACIGKWHLGWEWDALHTGTGEEIDRMNAMDWSRPVPGGPCDQGFEYYFGDDVPNFPPYTWIENDRVLVAPTEKFSSDPVPPEGNAEGRPGPMVAGWRLDEVMPALTVKAVEWIEQRAAADERFFLYFPFTSPHAPIVPTAEFAGKSEAGHYGDFVVQTDWTIGQMLETLDRCGLADNTLVIFSSDNGPEHYAYPRIRNFNHRSSGPLRGLKRDIWEGGHRVPMVVRWPSHVEAGRQCDELISQIDLLATVAAIVGAEIPENAAVDSHNQLALLTDPAARSTRRSLVHNTNRDHYAIRLDQWVLIDAPSGTVTKAPDWVDAAEGYTANELPVALYDLSNDLRQRHNVAADHPERVQQMQALLKATREAGEVR